MIKILTILTICSSMAFSQEIYLFSDVLTDASEARALVTIDEVPVLFINKGKWVDYVAGKIDCQDYEFKLKTNSNGKHLNKISYDKGKGDIIFVIDDKVVPFFNNIKNISYVGVGTTGVGPWREQFTCKINDIRFIPLTVRALADLINDRLDLTKKNIISDIVTKSQ